MATYGSTGSMCHSSPTISSTDDDQLPASQIDSLDTEDLVNFWQVLSEGNQPRHQDGINSNRFFRPSYQLEQSTSPPQRRHQGYFQSPNLSQPESMASNVAQPPQSTRLTGAINTHQSRLLSASAMPKSKPEVIYRQPQPFVGRLASESQLGSFTTELYSGRVRKRERDRPDIRAVPNYDKDPIE
jgi:hypothetical protein